MAIALSRRVVFHSTALLVSGVYLLFMAAAGYYVRYFGGSWGGALQVALMFAALLALGAMAFSGSLRAKLRVIVSKHFFRFRYDYRDEWLRFTHALSARGGQQELGQDVIKGLADMLDSPGGGLWLRDAPGRHFAQAARWNMPADSDTEPADGEFIRFLSETGWVVNLEEFRSSPERYRGLRFPLWLSELPNAWLIIPLANGDELIGFVVLATARARIEVNWEVNDLLKTAARQAATFLGQMQATEALLEARKFDAFNRMSAFVIHDLKNIVAQLSLMLKNAERHRENPEFQKDMLMTVEHSVERMKQLMMQLREGTTPVDAPHGVDLAAVIGRIQRAKSSQQPVPEIRLEERGCCARARRPARARDRSSGAECDRRHGQGRPRVDQAREPGWPGAGRGRRHRPWHDPGIRARAPVQAVSDDQGDRHGHRRLRELPVRAGTRRARRGRKHPDVGTQVRLLLPRFESAADAAVAARKEVA